MSLLDSWIETKKAILENIGSAAYEAWISRLQAKESSAPGVLVLNAPDEFSRDWVSRHYLKFIEDNLKKQTKELTKVELLVQPVSANIPPKKEPPHTADKPLSPLSLNPRYTFDNFVVGASNRFAHAASTAVSESPAKVYNPLFIYGGVGLGKTHLMQAICHAILKREAANLKICYLPSERFTNELIDAIQHRSTARFRQKYRNVDVLVIDDVHFIAGKESTQEEFFHTFNALHQNNKQIVISSDRPPKAIPGIENRLISRFEWGMIADISAPDLETRMAILEIKAQEKKYKLNKDIIHYVAENIQNNIRELEGALNRIIAFHQLNNTTPTLDSVKAILGGLSANHRRAGLTPRKLLESISVFYDISMENLLGASRKKELVVPRQIAMFLMREELKASYPNIGQEIGGRDHTTAMHACIKVTTLIEMDEKIKNDILILRQKIYE